MQTDRKTKFNEPNIVIKDDERKTCLRIDMLMRTDIIISVKKSNRISKCKELEIENEKMWHLATTIVPVIVGALGMIKKGIDKLITK